jgi:hypothetical protein
VSAAAGPPAGSDRRRFYVCGGRQRQDAFRRHTWQHYRQAVILRVDPAAGTAEPVVEYVSPPEATVERGVASIVFKAGSRDADRFFACTETEVLVYRLPGFELERYLSLPAFNDLHHVAPRQRGTLLVVSTGLDLVLEIDGRGEVVAEWDALLGEPWARFDRRVDYRKVATTKPHASHPNFAFEAEGEVWVTRFEQRDAVCLTRRERRLPIEVERPHDGVVLGRQVFFTTVDGHVAVADLATERVERLVDLNRIAGAGRALGWCRGLWPLSADEVVVGFSRLRPTRFRENVRWAKHRLGLRPTPGNLPTRIAAFDLAGERLLWELNLEELGLNAIFSLHPAG